MLNDNDVGKGKGKKDVWFLNVEKGGRIDLGSLYVVYKKLWERSGDWSF